ncbi:hypothetical protein MJG53_012463 [Ovis ammon polii x Ovis aries]|uniref:Uncharacterized protein n=1 Tax=Ovis ammon polii x Ovis aries TaxID=2918886 RepID=A0ACB9UNH5_9CETA|nr:hypothetical protein MJG53_012463 [Ovis ammon polii x Ovis aries]
MRLAPAARPRQLTERRGAGLPLREHAPAASDSSSVRGEACAPPPGFRARFDNRRTARHKGIPWVLPLVKGCSPRMSCADGFYKKTENNSELSWTVTVERGILERVMDDYILPGQIMTPRNLSLWSGFLIITKDNSRKAADEKDWRLRIANVFLVDAVCPTFEQKGHRDGIESDIPLSQDLNEGLEEKSHGIFIIITT